MMEPRYVLIKWNGWDDVATFIKTRKQLEEWLKDNSLEEGDVFYELKAKYKVKMSAPTFKDIGLVYEKIE